MKNVLTSFFSLQYLLPLRKCLRSTLEVNCVAGKKFFFLLSSYFSWTNVMDSTARDRCIYDEILILIYWNSETTGHYGL